MGFTIKCNECNNEQVFKPGDNARNTNIEMYIGDTGGYQPVPNEIIIYCENPACDNKIDLKY